MNGPGGDLMAIVYNDSQLFGYNGAGRAPASFTLADLRVRLAEINSAEIPTTGPLSITVPGAPRGWCDLHARFGKLPWQSLFKDAIDLATNGYPVPQIIAYEWNTITASPSMTSDGRFPRALDGWTSTFGSPAHSEGARFRNPALANTLGLLRDGGCDAFYVSGAIPDALASLAETAGTTFSRSDLAAHVGEWVTPINSTYRGYNLHQLPPNPQGAAALEILNILESFNFSRDDFNSADYLHAHVEAKKLAFADASFFFADPTFVDVPVTSLVSKPYAGTRRALINMSSAAKTDSPGAPGRLEDVYGGDTTYLTAADADGNMVSLIQSLYTGFGSGVVAGSLGFSLQSRGALFSVHDGAANVYAPGKRPFHTIMPGFCTGPNFTLSFGVMGGFMQPQGAVQVMSNIIDHGMNVQEAGDAARYYHSGSSTPMGDRMSDGGVLQLEAGVCDDVVANLTARGHTIVRGSNAGGYQAILRSRGPTGDFVYSGATEMRKDGLVAAW